MGGLVGISTWDRVSNLDSRSFDVAELSPLDLDTGVALLGCVSDFPSDVFSFTITISPYKKRLAILGLLLDVLCNILLVL